MTFDTDMLIDRRRLRRKLSFWRAIALVVVAAVLIFGILKLTGMDTSSKASPHIARLPINGIIVEDRRQLKLIKKISEDDNVKAVIVSINSPGGSTTGGETLYKALRRLSEKKPVVAEIRTVGASAGYMIALASDHILARYNSITGSIGVLFQYGNAAKLLETIGVEMDAVKSAPLKAEPDFYSPASDEAKAVLNDVVQDSYDWFVELVAERRKMKLYEARKLADGRIYSGHAAKKTGLLDAIGDETDVVIWLEKERSVEKDLPILDWTVEEEGTHFPLALKISQDMGTGFVKGITGSFDFTNDLISPTINLDGLLSVWQASKLENESKSRGQ